jgi:hypothetical protein
MKTWNGNTNQSVKVAFVVELLVVVAIVSRNIMICLVDFFAKDSLQRSTIIIKLCANKQQPRLRQNYKLCIGSKSIDGKVY